MQVKSLHRRRTRAPRLRAEERRQQVLEAALEVFAQRGYSGAGTAEIAAIAGVGEPTIYRYYASKEELYQAAVGFTAAVITANWQRIADENDDPLVALAQIGQWYYQTLLERPGILQLRFRSITDVDHPERASAAREKYLDLMRFIQGLFERAVAEGRLPEDADAPAMTWRFMAIGALLDVTNLLGIRDQLRPEDLMAIGRAVLKRRQ